MTRSRRTRTDVFPSAGQGRSSEEGRGAPRPRPRALSKVGTSAPRVVPWRQSRAVAPSVFLVLRQT